MSLQDFDRCTPPEFESIFNAWHKGETMAFRRGWEQTRTFAMCVLQPFSKKTLRPRDVMEFEWDPEAVKQERQKPRTSEELEAERRHYEEVKKARGLS